MLAFAILGLFGISFVVDLVTTELEELEEEAQEEANLTQRAPSTDGADDLEPKYLSSNESYEAAAAVAAALAVAASAATAVPIASA